MSSSTPHVLLYTDDPGQGGVAQYNHAMLLALAEQGYAVTCVQSHTDNPLVEARQQRGIPHVWLRYDTGQEFSRGTYDGSDAARIFQALQPDLIVFSDSCPASNVAARHQAMIQGIPFFMVEGFVAPAMTHHFAAPPMAEQCLRVLSHQFELAQEVVAVSQENLALLHRQYGLAPEKGQVIHYGRPETFFSPPDPTVRQRLRQELGIGETDILCFTAARLEQVKGHQYLLAAIAQLKTMPQWSRLRFAWAGAGQLRAELEQKIADLGVGDRVHLLGQRWDMPDWLDAADMFILPSHVEGMPLSIMEAMAKGVPVMASAVSGIPEELGETGILLTSPNEDPAATVQDLVQGIAAWAEQEEVRSQQGQLAQERATAMFQQERMVNETLQVVADALAQTSSPSTELSAAATEEMWKLERLFFPPQDYIAPGLQIVRPDIAFPNMTLGNPQSCPWAYLRKEVPHPWYVDQRHPFVGFLSRDEAHILYNLALPFRGKPALEIGCWMGWSACHLALAGVELDVIDPMLGQWMFYNSVQQSLSNAGVRERVTLLPGYSPQAVAAVAQERQHPWSLLFIDGDHETVGPLLDAIACEPFAATDALVVFHDLASPHVAEGLEYFRRKGWQTQIYQTMQIIGIAWRGNVQPVAHQPDPRITWALPAHLQQFAVCGIDPSSAHPSKDWDLVGEQRLQRIRHYLAEPHYARALHLVVAAKEAGELSPELDELRQQILTASDHAKVLPDRLPLPTAPAFEPMELYPLRSHNLIAFPDWHQSEAVLYDDLVYLLRTVLVLPKGDRTTLLIYSGDMDVEAADLALSSVALEVLAELGLDPDLTPEISLVTPLGAEEWVALRPHLHSRISLAHEDGDALAIAQANNLPILSTE
ncbi:glycosyltransferase [Vacuolonema iberomarrocanum]|uniref:glycosyltransferase n=1 Tax=Vacuolonema iberomarrocanum TaxID=3454632 RepID=UPI0019F39B63|nr:glycosyltransferase [filamentous cyanobacterium LEGE 07170]